MPGMESQQGLPYFASNLWSNDGTARREAGIRTLKQIGMDKE